MKIKELFEIYKFIKKSKGCIILKDNLELRLFGEVSDKLMYFRDVIMQNNS